MDAIERLEREMQVIQAESKQALNTANLAIVRMEAHEKVCALRYESIEEKLKSVSKIYDTLNALSRTVSLGVGVWTGTLAVGAVLGIVAAVIKFSGGN